MTFLSKESSDWVNGFERDGFVIVPDVLPESIVNQLIDSLRANDESRASPLFRESTYAIRNLLQAVPEVRRLAESVAIRSLVEAVLGAGAFPVRGLFFDKTEQANWKVLWHQDLTIAVRRRIEAPGFGPWSVKAGVPHVQPPIEVLERMVTLRLHLDDCAEQNGPLRVLPTSHQSGRLSARAIQELRGRIPAVSCVTRRGSALLMRPLLVHASSPAHSPTHRRVVHLESAAERLPGGLEWVKADDAIESKLDHLGTPCAGRPS